MEWMLTMMVSDVHFSYECRPKSPLLQFLVVIAVEQMLWKHGWRLCGYRRRNRPGVFLFLEQERLKLLVATNHQVPSCVMNNYP